MKRHPGWHVLDYIIAGIAVYVLVFIIAGVR